MSDINVLNFNDTLTNDIVSFEQLGPDCLDLVQYFLPGMHNSDRGPTTGRS